MEIGEREFDVCVSSQFQSHLVTNKQCNQHTVWPTVSNGGTNKGKETISVAKGGTDQQMKELRLMEAKFETNEGKS